MINRHKKKVVANARKKSKKRASPLRFDPTRTTTLRRAFIARLRWGFARLRLAVVDLIERQDALGLREVKRVVGNVFCATGVGGGVDPSCGKGDTHAAFVSKDRRLSRLLHDYSGGGTHYIEVNEMLRKSPGKMLTMKSDPDSYERGSASRTASALQQATQSAPSLDRDVYRGINSKTAKDLLKTAKEGGVVRLDGFQSTSFDESVATDFAEGARLTIKSPKGLSLGSHSYAGQSEVLLPHGADYRIESIDKTGKVPHLVITQLNKGYKIGGNKNDLKVNAFCPTGPGGGVDPSCSPSGSMGESTMSNGLSHFKVMDYAADKLADKWNVPKSVIDKLNSEERIKPDTPGRDKNAFVYSMIRQWQGSSGSTTSLEVIKGGLSAAGLDATKVNTHEDVDKWFKDNPGVRESLHDLGKEMYSSTQGWLSKNGVTEIKLYRKGSVDRPFSSWTTSPGWARQEAAGSVVEHTIPAKYIMSLPATGFGSKDEHEVVVLGGWNRPTTNERWRFHSDPDKLKQFQDWLKTQIKAFLVGMTEEELWTRYVEEGFKKGAGRAFEDVKPRSWGTPAQAEFYAGSKDQFLKSAFGRPESVSKVKLLASRSFDEMKGMTEDMTLKMGRALTDGLVRGANPLEIARDLVRQIDVSRNRAETIARTEIIRAHAEGQLQAFEEMGVDEIGVMVEWTVTEDEALCPLCEAMAGVVLKIEEARGVIPRHPNCRCAFIPANVGEETDDQTRGKSKIVQAVKISARMGNDGFSTAVPVSKVRPTPPVPVTTNGLVRKFSSLLRSR